MSWKLSVCSVLLFVCVSCGAKGPVNTTGPGVSPVTQEALVAQQAATRRQIVINLDRAQLAVGDAITVKRRLRTEGLINHDTEVVITDGLGEVNGIVLSALTYIRDNPVFDLSSGSKIAGFVNQLSARAESLTANSKLVFKDGAARQTAQTALAAITTISGALRGILPP